jgi:hypothetical protein
MAAELAQLIAEKPEAAAAAATEEPGAESSPVPADLAAAVQSIMDNPVQMAEKGGGGAVAASVDAPAPVVAPDATVIDAPAEAAAPVAVAADDPAKIVAALDTLAAATPRPSAARPNILVRAWRLVVGMFIMVLQVVDMPFGWIKEPDKNVLGMAALLLLLGGAVLKVLSWWMEHH